jgi:hypothetical protein
VVLYDAGIAHQIAHRAKMVIQHPLNVTVACILSQDLIDQWSKQIAALEGQRRSTRVAVRVCEVEQHIVAVWRKMRRLRAS